MKTIIVALALIWASVANATVITSQYHGSYQCGNDWWHVEQNIQETTVLSRFGTSQVYASMPAINIVDIPSANVVQIWCWASPSPVPMSWGGFSYYNSAPMGGTPSTCVMWTHRQNATWKNSATVDVRPGGLLLYPGSPVGWSLDVYDAGGGGNHDGLAACGGHFSLLLQ